MGGAFPCLFGQDTTLSMNGHHTSLSPCHLRRAPSLEAVPCKAGTRPIIPALTQCPFGPPGAASIASACGGLTGPYLLRYWHSTATYAIATEVSGGLQHLPPAHHLIYRWPRDLLRPNLVVLLTVNPEERLRRMQARGLDRTREEEELEANSIFRQK